jgi:hypothetical protein
MRQSSAESGCALWPFSFIDQFSINSFFIDISIDTSYFIEQPLIEQATCTS